MMLTFCWRRTRSHACKDTCGLAALLLELLSRCTASDATPQDKRGAAQLPAASAGLASIQKPPSKGAWAETADDTDVPLAPDTLARVRDGKPLLSTNKLPRWAQQRSTASASSAAANGGSDGGDGPDGAAAGAELDDEDEAEDADGNHDGGEPQVRSPRWL
jgi:hypothetical protein